MNNALRGCLYGWGLGLIMGVFLTERVPFPAIVSVAVVAIVFGVWGGPE